MDVWIIYVYVYISNQEVIIKMSLGGWAPNTECSARDVWVYRRASQTGNRYRELGCYRCSLKTRCCLYFVCVRVFLCCRTFCVAGAVSVYVLAAVFAFLCWCARRCVSVRVCVCVWTRVCVSGFSWASVFVSGLVSVSMSDFVFVFCVCVFTTIR